MRGQEETIALVGAVIILIIFVGIFWYAVRGGEPTKVKATEGGQLACRADSDCLDNIKGSKCITIYGATGASTPTCGCTLWSDCQNCETEEACAFICEDEVCARK